MIEYNAATVTFGQFLDAETPLPLPIIASDRMAVVRDTDTYYATPHDLGAIPVPVQEVDGGTGVGNLDDAPVLATGSTTERTLGERFGGIVNVKDFGAVMDGVTVDTPAYIAAVNAVSPRGAIVVPAGGVNAGGFTDAWASKPILWLLSGNAFGTGSTPVNTLGNGVVESFFANTTKYFGRNSSRSTYTGTDQVPSLGPVVRVDMQLDHIGGTTGGIQGLQVTSTTTAASAPNAFPFAITAQLNMNSSQPSGPPGVALSAFTFRGLGAGPAQPFGINAGAHDFTALPSGTAGSLVSAEINIKANKLDDGMLADGYHQNDAAAIPGANRVILDLKYLRTNRSDNTPTSFGAIINMGPGFDFEEPYCSVKNAIMVNADITFAALNIMTSRLVGEANAIALGPEHRLAWTSDDPRNVLPIVPTNFRYFQYTLAGTDRLRYVVGTTEVWSISDAGLMSLGVLPINAANDAAASAAGVPVGGVYRNGSAIMVRAA